jgi:hypothetical protein
MKEFRQAMDASGKGRVITVASPAADRYIKHYDLPELSKHCKCL